jgi:hypothetical protein
MWEQTILWYFLPEPTREIIPTIGTADKIVALENTLLRASLIDDAKQFGAKNYFEAQEAKNSA